MNQPINSFYHNKIKFLVVAFILLLLGGFYFFLKNIPSHNIRKERVEIPLCELMKERASFYQKYVNANVDKISDADQKKLWAILLEIDKTSLAANEAQCIKLLGDMESRVDELSHYKDLKPIEESECHKAIHNVLAYYFDIDSLSEPQKKSIGDTVVAINANYGLGR